MTIWPPDPSRIKRPAYRSLAEIIVEAIEAGELAVGARLPTHRRLAYDLGLSVQTVSRAYDTLIRRGAITAHVGRGTFVSAGLAEAHTPFPLDGQTDLIVDCSILKPAHHAFHAERMRIALQEMSRDLSPASLFSFRPSTAIHPFRGAALKWLAQCGLEADAEQVLLTNGSTPAMTIALMTAAGPGDLVVTEAVGHHTLKSLTRYLGMRLEGLALDGEGIVPASFERACSGGAVAALFVMPNGLAPLAATMGAERRAALCAIARRHDVAIIENDAWGPLQPNRPPPLARLAPERTFYFTSFTKCLMAGLRSGYLVSPPLYASAAANRHLVANWTATPLIAELAARWVEDGTAFELLEWQRGALGERNARAAEILAGLGMRQSVNGLHVWLPLPEFWTEEQFVAHARHRGVAVAPGSLFAISDAPQPAGIRVCLGGDRVEALARGLEIIAELLRNQPEPDLLSIYELS